MHARLFLLLLTLLPSAAWAGGEVLNADVQHARGTYTLALDMKLAADPEAVYAALTDYANLHRINDTVRSSTVLYARDPKYRVRIVIDTCVLLFCSELVQVQQITHRGDREIAVYVIPDDENFRSGAIRWRVFAEDEGTRVTMDAEYEPAFWVPPLIGPAVLKRKLRNDAVQTVSNLERLANPTHGAEAKP